MLHPTRRRKTESAHAFRTAKPCSRLRRRLSSAPLAALPQVFSPSGEGTKGVQIGLFVRELLLDQVGSPLSAASRAPVPILRTCSTKLTLTSHPAPLALARTQYYFETIFPRIPEATWREIKANIQRSGFDIKVKIAFVCIQGRTFVSVCCAVRGLCWRPCPANSCRLLMAEKGPVSVASGTPDDPLHLCALPPSCAASRWGWDGQQPPRRRRRRPPAEREGSARRFHGCVRLRGCTHPGESHPCSDQLSISAPPVSHSAHGCRPLFPRLASAGQRAPHVTGAREQGRGNLNVDPLKGARAKTDEREKRDDRKDDWRDGRDKDRVREKERRAERGATCAAASASAGRACRGGGRLALEEG